MKKSILLFTILTILLLTQGFYEGVSAHSWYDAACCSDADCHPVDCTELIERGKSIFYKGYEFYNSMIRPTQDASCHVCISNLNNPDPSYTPVPHCVYIQNNS